MAHDNTMTRGSLETRREFKQTPSDQYRYWLTELEASERQLRDFKKMGTQIVKRYLGGTRAGKADALYSRQSRFRLNLFHSNVTTLQSMLFGNLPKVRVSRRHDDANDDVGRTAAMILERLLNNDVQDNGKEYCSVLRACIQDRLLPGLGCARVRYVYDPQSGHEDAVADYYHWRDVAWGWARTFSEIPWIGFRSYLRKEEVEKRFGKDVAKQVQLKGESVTGNDAQQQDSYEDDNSPWRKAEIWEIWDKENRRVVWVSPGYDKVLESRPDPLGLSGFFPCPPFMLANQTTSLYIPTSDYALAQDLYNEVDTLQTRISIITEAVKVVGVYDRNAEGVGRMFKEGTDNDLIPVDNWALFAEKGGIDGQIDWVPIGEISETLLRLRELRDEAIGLLQQVTGMSDIMRGELHGQYEGVGQSELKEKYGSVRIQAMQDEFAQFASDLLQIKAEIIGKHFSPETIARFANVNETFDVELVPAAIQLIKNPAEAKLRVEVRPESLSMVDYAQLRTERVEYIQAIGGFLTAAAPIVETQPSAKPFLLELMKWGLAGFKGSNDVEGIVDKAVEASKMEQPQQDDGEAAKEQAKFQGQMQLEQLKHQNEIEIIQLKAQADMATSQQDLQSDIAKRNAELQAEIAEIQANMQAAIMELKAKMQTEIMTERATSAVNAQQEVVEGQVEMQKDSHQANLDVQKEIVKTRLDIAKQEEQTKQKIKELKAAPKPTASTPTKPKSGK